MTNQELKYELENKLIEVFPLTKKESYEDISTEDIIESLNQMKWDVQNKTGRQVLEDLPNFVPRDAAIDMSTKLFSHITKKLVNEIKKL
jgi:hypothetical protein